MLQNAWPALVLLALMVGIAWALKWARGRMPGLPGVPGQQGPALKVLSSVSLGPQQRVVTLQVGQGADATCLVLGVAPGSVNTLHQLALPADTAAPAAPVAAGGFAARLAQQLVKGPNDAPR
ncbi:MAG: flagellar biosynthetic protein FliO [Hydrogenophaga sp.]|uniref:FliO/MopB family protein n=1 Tax=Hydrogenophaga sp. TaxID=1904254 RepID=UPI001D9963AE|nr:flagellar biosynthetic protein FliO [Hydrogenophaga sp.]MBX3609666.1 flagellar biosynthetic protein FliO [Hydrogenophaga sp.]